MVKDAPALLSAGGAPLFDMARRVLLASHCKRCGRTHFPQREICTSCFVRGEMVEHPLGREGIVRASTIVRVRSALGHEPPYAYGSVEVGEVLVFTRFAGCAPERVVPGLAVELGFETLRCAALGELLIHVFRPRSAA